MVTLPFLSALILITLTFHILTTAGSNEVNVVEMIFCWRVEMDLKEDV